MTWETAVVVMVYMVPFGMTYMANKQLDPEVNEHFWWIRLLIFLFNIILIGLGLWVGQVIAASNNTVVASLMQTAWRAYIWLMSFVVGTILLLIIIQGVKVLVEKFPSLKEER